MGAYYASPSSGRKLWWLRCTLGLAFGPLRALGSTTTGWFADYMFTVDTPEGSQEINASFFQDDLRKYYFDQWPPPSDVAFLIVSMAPDLQNQIREDCPMLLAMAYVITAEMLLYTQPQDAYLHAQIAESIAVNAGDPSGWPWNEGMKQFTELMTMLEKRKDKRGRSSVDVVIARCTEPLTWRRELPEHWRVFIYEKCGEQSSDAQPDDVVVSLANKGMESFAYAQHCAFVSSVNRSDFTIFMQADYVPHIELALFDSVKMSLLIGTYNTPFLHLNKRRFMATHHPCLREILNLVNTSSALPSHGGIVGSYCCNQFVVRRDRFLDVHVYETLANWFQGHIRTTCVQNDAHDPRPGIAQSAMCEHLWHILFSEPGFLPLRSRDVRLPAFLRIDSTDPAKKRLL